MGAKQSILASKEKGPQQISFDGMWSPTSLRRRADSDRLPGPEYLPVRVGG